MQSARKRIGKASMVLLIIYGAIVLYYVLFSERLGRADAYDTLRYNLHPFEEIRRFIVYREYVSPGAFVLNLLGNIFVFSPFGFLLPLYRLEKTGPVRVMLYSFLFMLPESLFNILAPHRYKTGSDNRIEYSTYFSNNISFKELKRRRQH